MDIRHTSQVQAEEMTPIEGYLMISITDPFETADVSGWDSILRLQFYDINEEVDGLPAFQADHVQAVKGVCEKAKRGEFKGIIVHCYAGISRSSAIAKYLSEEINGFYDTDFWNLRIYAMLTGNPEHLKHEFKLDFKVF